MHVAQIIAEKGASVLTAGANDRITRLLKLLASRNVGAIVICDAAGAVIGIVSERDIVRAFADNGAAVLDMTAADLMTREVVTCSKEDTVIELMSVMTERRIRHLPVIDDGVLGRGHQHRRCRQVPDRGSGERTDGPPRLRNGARLDGQAVGDGGH